jgi:hypothetical protein
MCGWLALLPISLRRDACTMPSAEHEVIVVLFQNRPRLAAELSDAALVEPPPWSRTDALVARRQQVPVLAIVVEHQRQPEESKRQTWPLVTVHVGALFRCPTTSTTLTQGEATRIMPRHPSCVGDPR